MKKIRRLERYKYTFLESKNGESMRKKVGITLEEELWRELRMIAIKEGTSASRIIERLISEFLENKKGRNVESKKSGNIESKKGRKEEREYKLTTEKCKTSKRLSESMTSESEQVKKYDWALKLLAKQGYIKASQIRSESLKKWLEESDHAIYLPDLDIFISSAYVEFCDYDSKLGYKCKKCGAYFNTINDFLSHYAMQHMKIK